MGTRLVIDLNMDAFVEWCEYKGIDWMHHAFDGWINYQAMLEIERTRAEE